MNILESYYYHFRVYPYQAKTVRSIRKEPKMYLWDWTEVKNEASRFENMIASHLLKFTHFLHDYEGYKADLHFLRDRDQREVDFLVTVDEKPWFAVEVKLHEMEFSKNLFYFQERLKIPYTFQLVRDPQIRKSKKDACLISADSFLSLLT